MTTDYTASRHAPCRCEMCANRFGDQAEDPPPLHVTYEQCSQLLEKEAAAEREACARAAEQYPDDAAAKAIAAAIRARGAK